jgi:hypothetical protein
MKNQTCNNLFFIFFTSLLFFGCLKEKDTDNSPPVINILNPANNSSFEEGNEVKIQIDIVDESEIQEVELLIDGKIVKRFSSWPYSYDWNVKDNIGSHTILAKATDIYSNTGSSSIITIQVTKKPPNILTGEIRNTLEEKLENVKVYFYNEDVTSKLKSQFTPIYAIDVESFRTVVLNTSSEPEPLDSIYTDENGQYSFETEETGTFTIKTVEGGYENFKASLNIIEGTNTFNVTLNMSEIPQIKNLSLTQDEDEILLKWDQINLPTIQGYNIYEGHYYGYEMNGDYDGEYIYPEFTSSKKINEMPISSNTYNYKIQKYNSGYRFYVLPVNKENLESTKTDETELKYKHTEDNIRFIGIFGLVDNEDGSGVGPYDIPNTDNEVAMWISHLSYENENVYLINWDISYSYDNQNWKNLFQIARYSRNEGNAPRGKYGGWVSKGLNSFKGKQLYFNTDIGEWQSPDKLTIKHRIYEFINQ